MNSEELEVRRITEKVLKEQNLYDLAEMYKKEHNIFRGTHKELPLHYTKEALDNFFEGEDQDKKQVHWDRVTSKPDTYPPSSHIHDDRYYTESEINALLAAQNEFKELSDTPASYASEGGKGIRVKIAEDGLEFYTLVDTDEKVKVGAAGVADYLNENYFERDVSNHIRIKQLTVLPGVNVPKWNGQVHYLTDVQPGDILRYNSVDFRWENEPFAHAHVKADITDTPWAWADVLKTGSNLTDLATRQHAGLTDITESQHHVKTGHDEVYGLMRQGLAAGKGDPTPTAKIYYETDTGILKQVEGAAWVERLRAEASTRLAQLSEKAHGSLTGVTSGQHHAQLHASTHEPSGSDQIDLVFNSQKWNGQTIYLTDVTNGQILRYDSGDLRWENYDVPPPPAHATSHEKGGSDEIDTLGDLTIDKFIIGSYYLDTDGLVANNKVFNSSKWDGQTIYLTEVTNGQVLRYNSTTFRWENYDFIPSAHASSHLVGGTDALSVGIPVNIGTANNAGTATNFARRDHVHAHPSALGTDLHHPQSHTLASHSTKAHSELSDAPANAHHPQLHAATHEPSASDQIDLVFNSQKWSGQTIYLTGVTNGQILRYDSGDLRWENADMPPPGLHASTHEPSAGDQIELVFNSQKWNGQTILLTDVTNGQILRYDSGDLRWENYDFVHASAHHVGGGDLVNHDSLTGFVAAEHKSLPNTIAQVLSDHTLAVHNALAIDHGSLSGRGDDDHSQYYNAARHTVAIHDALGINAHRVDGYHASQAAGNNTVVVRSAAGYIYCNYLNCTSGETSTNPTHYFVEIGNDSFLRQMTPAVFISNLRADGLMGVIGGIFTGGIEAADHTVAGSDKVVNVSFGTGNPPAANTTTKGSLFIRYTA